MTPEARLIGLLGMEWYVEGKGAVPVTLPSARVGAVRLMEVRVRMGGVLWDTPCPKGWEVSKAPKPATLSPPLTGAVTFRQPVTSEDECSMLIECDGADIFVTTWVEEPPRAPTPEVWAAARNELLGICNRL